MDDKITAEATQANARYVTRTFTYLRSVGRLAAPESFRFNVRFAYIALDDRNKKAGERPSEEKEQARKKYY